MPKKTAFDRISSDLIVYDLNLIQKLRLNLRQ